MTGPAALLADLHSGGFQVRVDGSRLIVKPASKLSDDLRSRIRQDLANLVAVIAATANDVYAAPEKPDDHAVCREAFEERAAIRQHDGGQARADAERGAAVDLLRLSKAQADDCHAGGWEDDEISMFRRRMTAMQARGYETESAEAMAEALVYRDRQGDDRRVCLECTHLGERGRCLAATTGHLPGTDRRLVPVPTVLHRCPAFGLRKGLE